MSLVTLLVAGWGECSDRGAGPWSAGETPPLCNTPPCRWTRTEKGLEREWSAIGGPNPIVPDDKQGEFREHFQMILEGNLQQDTERYRRHKNGTLIPISLSAAPLHDSLGRVVGAVGLLLDISARKASEAERSDALATCQAALAEVDRLRGLLPICASCKKIRDEAGVWHAIETYVRDHADVEFSHGICPACKAELYPEYE